jgi:hypothetical protein
MMNGGAALLSDLQWLAITQCNNSWTLGASTLCLFVGLLAEA